MRSTSTITFSLPSPASSRREMALKETKLENSITVHGEDEAQAAADLAYTPSRLHCAIGARPRRPGPIQ